MLPSYTVEDLKIRRVTVEDALPIRHKVLWPNLPLDSARVDEDDVGLHYGAFYRGWLVGVASLYLGDGGARLRKFAVLPEYRGHGIGTLMVEELLECAGALGAQEFWCDARETAVPFYQRFGLKVDGDPFIKRDLRYVRMSTPLRPDLFIR
ncbi:GNAT family N-acetyltransferase [Pseudovibrio exalbescens]|uniref:GNAT family N-acetyltransferase n=1 Tax=Pseudovibrio exalbescens TaxID=197461 RepID=UPI000C9D0E67|nr:GNAT family N-acetyltransferase [Pseudovibrio exalbescens]